MARNASVFELGCGCRYYEPKPGGKAPRRYCPDHKPARSDHYRKWYQANKAKVAEYQRQHNGNRPYETRCCVQCGAEFRTYKGHERCVWCRNVDLKSCWTCGTPFRPTGGRDRYCNRYCKPGPTGGHDSPAYKRAKAEGDPIVASVVFNRDKWRCHLCGEKVDRRLSYPDPRSASLDHVRPISRGGTHTYFNVRLTHLSCNLAKGAPR